MASLYVWYLQYWALCDDLVDFKLRAGVRYFSFSIDKPDARKPLDFNLLRISPEFLIDQNSFYHFFHKLLCNI